MISRSPTDVQPVFDTIVNSAVRLCNGVFGAIYRMEGGLVDLAGTYNIPNELVERIRAMFPARPHRGMLATRAILDGTVVQSPDLEADPEFRLHDISRSLGMRSLVGVPMLREGMSIGAISIGRSVVGPFPASQIELPLKTFADQAVIAIENVRLFQELRARTAELTRSVGELTALGEVGRALSSTLDLETVLKTIVTRADELAGTDGCLIYEYDDTREEFRLRASSYADPERGRSWMRSVGRRRFPKGRVW